MSFAILRIAKSTTGPALPLVLRTTSASIRPLQEQLAADLARRTAGSPMHDLKIAKQKHGSSAGEPKALWRPQSRRRRRRPHRTSAGRSTGAPAGLARVCPCCAERLLALCPLRRDQERRAALPQSRACGCGRGHGDPLHRRTSRPRRPGCLGERAARRAYTGAGQPVPRYVVCTAEADGADRHRQEPGNAARESLAWSRTRSRSNRAGTRTSAA